MVTRKQKRKPKRKAARKKKAVRTEVVQIIQRQVNYAPSTRKDDDRLVGLLAEQGTRWESTLRPVTWSAADAKDRQFIRQFELYFKPFRPPPDKLPTVAEPHIEHIRRFIARFRAANPNHWK